MTKLSKHITVEEMACRCPCHICRVSPELLVKAEVARTAMNIFYCTHDDMITKHIEEVKLYISSGCRCVEHNHKEGGVDDSRHIAMNNIYPPSIGLQLAKTRISKSKDTKALDGWFYYGDSAYHNRLDASDVLRRMWEDELISGVVLYPSVACGKCIEERQKGMILLTNSGKIKGTVELRKKLYLEHLSGTEATAKWIKCPHCMGDGILTEHRFHIEVADRRFWEDRR